MQVAELSVPTAVNLLWFERGNDYWIEHRVRWETGQTPSSHSSQIISIGFNVLGSCLSEKIFIC